MERAGGNRRRKTVVAVRHVLGGSSGRPDRCGLATNRIAGQIAAATDRAARPGRECLGALRDSVTGFRIFAAVAAVYLSDCFQSFAGHPAL
ncbi:Hypothetical protein NTJ_03849 [Nesidiocoris tenuis]|uniref:Uncharacterized protein n=1 Tax=Nesidiocoris tenuis TaxID=355587 RepID=A0ABN7AFI3_9HEMI|nr:Hypothetical protein NTJ_03849 [Nesidiocoris tenuis]